MKEQPTTIEPRETPVRMWRLKSEVMVPNEMLNQDANGFIHVPYKKYCSLTKKFIFDTKHGLYTYIPEAKRRPQICISEVKCGSHTHISEFRCGSQIRIFEDKRGSQTRISAKNNLASKAHGL